MSREFWSPFEVFSRDEISHHQLRKLKEQVNYIAENSPFYQGIFRENHISPMDIKSLDDLTKLPFTDKFMVSESQLKKPPFGEMLCVPEKDIVKYFRTSGTTLEPRNFAYTWRDWWDVAVETLTRLFWAVDVRADDKVFIAFPYSTFIALWTSHYAGEKIGCMILPGGGISTVERLHLMKKMKATVLCATPTYSNYLATAAVDEGIDIRDIPMRVIHTGGEPLSAVPGSRKRIQEIWQAKAYDSYGCSEGLTPLGGECKAQDGMHCSEEFVIPEILDENGNPVPPGGQGELVVTNIVSKSMPLIRFKSGDVVTYTNEPCSCGQNSIRFKVVGRTDDMILIKGNNVFPSTVEEMVKQCDELSNDFMIVIDEIDGQYELIVQVEPAHTHQFTRDEAEQARNHLVSIFRENLRMRPVVEFVEKGSLPRFEVKAKRLIDKRQK